MAETYHLELDPFEGGWLVRGRLGEDAAHKALVPATAVQAVLESCRALSGAEDRDDADWERLERAVGDALGRALGASPRIMGELLGGLSRAREDGVALRLVLHLGQSLGALPWELLAFEGQPIELDGSGVVLRSAHATPRALQPYRHPRGLGLICPDPDDDVMDRLRAQVTRAAGELDTETSGRAVLLLAHGESDAAGFRTMDGPEGLGSASVASHLRGAGLVLALVCGAGGGSLARDLLDAGVPLVFAPGGSLGEEAAARLARRYVQGVAAGEGLEDLVGALGEEATVEHGDLPLGGCGEGRR